MRKKLIMRWVLFSVGIAILTLGARILLLSNLGVGGLDAIAIGLSNWTGMSIGSFIIILGGVLTIIGSMINKHLDVVPIGVSLLIGWLYDLWGVLVFNKIIPAAGSPHTGYVFLIGILIAPLGAALYIQSKISVGPVDYLMLAVKKHYNSSLQNSRILIETIFVLIGWLIKGPIGVGTICIMLFWGPILQVYCNVLERIGGEYIQD